MQDLWFPASACVITNNLKTGCSLFMSGTVSSLVDNLYAEAIEAVKSHTSSSASTPELISILDDIKSEARL
jgi:hypothetical protein